jgi:hypothetical protein
MVVVAPTHILVDDAWTSRSDVERRCAIEVVLQYRAHMPVRTSAGDEHLRARGVGTLVAVALGEPIDPEAGAVALLGMTALFEDRFCEHFSARADAFGPAQDAIWRPFRLFLVRDGHVLVDGRVLAACVASRVATLAPPGVKHLQRRGRRAQPELLAMERVRGGVVVPVELGVIVDVETSLLPLGELERLERQRTKCYPLEFINISRLLLP